MTDAVENDTRPESSTYQPHLHGLPDSAIRGIAELLEQGLFQKDVTKLKDLMLAVGRKMLDDDYREYFAASLGDIVHNLGSKLLQMAQTGKVNGTVVVGLVARYFESLNDESSACVKLLIHYSKDRELSDSAVKLTILAMAIGHVLKLSPKDVKELGTLGLLSKVGLALVSTDVRSRDERLNAIEQLDIKKVPQQTAVLLEKLVGLPDRISMIANQIYEVGDGSGYPRGLKLNNTNQLARIIKLSDTYVALTHAKPYRKPVEPHAAIVYLNQMAKQGRFDMEATTALTNLVGIYPAGTNVILSDGRSAIVLGVSGKIMLPVVQLKSDRSIIDLTDSDLTIKSTDPSAASEMIVDWREIPSPMGNLTRNR